MRRVLYQRCVMRSGSFRIPFVTSLLHSWLSGLANRCYAQETLFIGDCISAKCVLRTWSLLINAT